ncbi:MOSC domain-containing protein [Nemania sp. FL0916]|nr:MOSC domain-containing protein [Nemania sp. FL0916]
MPVCFLRSRRDRVLRGINQRAIVRKLGISPHAEKRKVAPFTIREIYSNSTPRIIVIKDFLLLLGNTFRVSFARTSRKHIPYFHRVKMKITEIYIYPIKSLAPLSVPRTRLRREGVEHDRRFMLLKVNADGTYKNIQIVHVPECALFHQRLDGDEIVVTYHVPSPPIFTPEVPEQSTALRVPLSPKLEDRAVVDVSICGSSAPAYRMGDPYDSWFTACFGYEVILVYIGDHSRDVLAHKPGEHYLWRQHQPRPKGGWLSGISAYIPGGAGTGNVMPDKGSDQLVFNEIAPFLVTSKASLRDVSRRLPEGEDMDMRRFRPNIVVDGNPQDPGEGGEEEGSLAAWEEDYWAELCVVRSTGEEHRLALTANCGRCLSINIDYDTGRPSQGEPGIVLKKLMADRRVDEGNKYSPIFGRYGFLAPGGSQGTNNGVEIAVGDHIHVTKRLDYRDSWAWPKY